MEWIEIEEKLSKRKWSFVGWTNENKTNATAKLFSGCWPSFCTSTSSSIRLAAGQVNARRMTNKKRNPYQNRRSDENRVNHKWEIATKIVKNKEDGDEMKILQNPRRHSPRRDAHITIYFFHIFIIISEQKNNNNNYFAVRRTFRRWRSAKARRQLLMPSSFVFTRRHRQLAVIGRIQREHSCRALMSFAILMNTKWWCANVARGCCASHVNVVFRSPLNDSVLCQQIYRRFFLLALRMRKMLMRMNWTRTITK